MLAEDWAEDLEPFALELVEHAAKMHRRNSKFFPCVSEIIVWCKDLETKEAMESQYTLPCSGAMLDGIDFDYQQRMSNGLLQRMARLKVCQ